MILGKLKKFYDRKIYFKIDHIRGATRLRLFLKYLAERESEKISEEDAESIFEYEWKNLIILDACRHDIYEEVTGKEADHRFSIGSNSEGFVKGNFSSGDWSDTVVVTGNPFYHPTEFERLTGRKLDNVFEDVFLLFASEDHRFGTGDWDGEKGTVLPEKIYERAILAEKLYPEKRKIIHFMQPHTPFLSLDLDVEGWNRDRKNKNNIDGTKNVYEYARKGLIEKDTLIQGYRENLEMVLPYLEKLGENFSDKTLVTADHGELLGEINLFGHSITDSDIKYLRKVPLEEI